MRIGNLSVDCSPEILVLGLCDARRNLTVMKVQILLQFNDIFHFYMIAPLTSVT